MPDNEINVKVRASVDELNSAMKSGVASVEDLAKSTHMAADWTKLLTQTITDLEKAGYSGEGALRAMAAGGAGIPAAAQEAARALLAQEQATTGATEAAREQVNVLKRIRSEEEAIEAAWLAAIEENARREEDARHQTARALEEQARAHERALEGEKRANEQLAESISSAIENPLHAAAGAARGFVIEFGAMGVAAVVTGGALALAGEKVYESAREVMEYSESVEVMSAQLGINMQAVQLWTHMADVSGGVAGAMQGAVRRLSQQMEQNTPAAIGLRVELQKMGAELYDVHGKLLPLEALFPNILRLLASMEDSTKRNALEIQLFGRGGLVLNALGKSWDETAKQIQSSNLLISDSTLKANSEANQAWELMEKRIKSMERTVGSAVVQTVISLDTLKDAYVSLTSTLAKDAGDGLKRNLTVMQTALGLVSGTGGPKAAAPPKAAEGESPAAKTRREGEEDKKAHEEAGAKLKEAVERNQAQLHEVLDRSKSRLDIAQEKLKKLYEELTAAAGKPGDISKKVAEVEAQERLVRSIEAEEQATQRNSEAQRALVALRREDLIARAQLDGATAAQILRSAMVLKDAAPSTKAETAALEWAKIGRVSAEETRRRNEEIAKSLDDRYNKQAAFYAKEFEANQKAKAKLIEEDIKSLQGSMDLLNKAEAEQDRRRKSEEAAQLAHQARMFDIERQSVEQQYAMHRISAERRLQLMQEIAAREEALQLATAKRGVTAAQAGQVEAVSGKGAAGKQVSVAEKGVQSAMAQAALTGDVAALEAAIIRLQAARAEALSKADIEVQNAVKKVESIEDQSRKRREAANLQMIQHQAASVERIFSPISRTLDQSVQGIVMGTQTIGQAWNNMASNMLASWTGMLLQAGVKWAEHQVMRLAIHTSTNAAVVASDATTAATSNAISSTMSLKEIGRAAAKAAAKTWAAVSDIPVVGPFLAPAAAAAAFTGVMAFRSLAAFEKGGNVTEDQVALLHKREMVLPADLAEGVRSAFAPGGNGQQGGRSGNSIQLSYYAPQGVTPDQLSQHANHLFSLVQKEMRRRNLITA